MLKYIVKQQVIQQQEFNSQLDSDISMEVVLLETQPKQPQETENQQLFIDNLEM